MTARQVRIAAVVAGLLFVGAVISTLRSCGGDDPRVADEVTAPRTEPPLVSESVEVFHVVGQGETFGDICTEHGVPYADMLQMVEASEEIQRLIAELGVEDEAGLQAWFTRRIDAFLTERGRRLVGWPAGRPAG